MKKARAASLPASLLRANRAFAEAHPGESGARQPVHTVYGGAHLFRFDTAPKLGALARRAFEEHAPTPRAFAEALRLAVPDGRSAQDYAETIHARVRPGTSASPTGAVVELDAEAFEALVVDELDQLPDDMVDGLENVVFVVEDRPEDVSLDLLGLYDGYALTERDRYGMGEMPDRIILYREPLLAVADDEEQLRDEIHVTLVHEIAHFYGIDDDRLHELGWA